MFKDILSLIKQSIACGTGQVLMKAVGINRHGSGF